MPSDLPMAVFELKPILPTEPLPPSALCACLLQAFYCLGHYRLSGGLFCLTDLKQWNYFEIEVIKGNPYALINIVSMAKVEYENVAPSALLARSMKCVIRQLTRRARNCAHAQFALSSWPRACFCDVVYCSPNWKKAIRDPRDRCQVCIRLCCISMNVILAI